MGTLKRKVCSHAFGKQGCFRFGKVAIVATLESKKNVFDEVCDVSLALGLFEGEPRNRFDSLAVDRRQLPAPHFNSICVSIYQHISSFEIRCSIRTETIIR